MNAILPVRLTVDEFLRWSADQESGRFELEGGAIVTMPSETVEHTGTKQQLFVALREAVARSGLPFYAMVDGPSVRISEDRVYQPDGLIAPRPRPPKGSLEISNPIAVFEVLSPTPKSVRRDLTTKLAGYSGVATIEHYVVIDPDERLVIHFRRRGDRLDLAGELQQGPFRLDPPGIETTVESMLEAES